MLNPITRISTFQKILRYYVSDSCPSKNNTACDQRQRPTHIASTDQRALASGFGMRPSHCCTCQLTVSLFIGVTELYPLNILPIHDKTVVMLPRFQQPEPDLLCNSEQE
jgi:hypothetical protein